LRATCAVDHNTADCTVLSTPGDLCTTQSFSLGNLLLLARLLPLGTQTLAGFLLRSVRFAGHCVFLLIFNFHTLFSFQSLNLAARIRSMSRLTEVSTLQRFKRTTVRLNGLTRYAVSYTPSAVAAKVRHRHLVA
jgi:hypothetical protein